MRDVERLHEIIDALPPQQVHALLTLLAPPSPSAMRSSPVGSRWLPKKKSTKGPPPASSPPKPNTEKSSLTAN